MIFEHRECMFTLHRATGSLVPGSHDHALSVGPAPRGDGHGGLVLHMHAHAGLPHPREGRDDV